MKALVPRFAAPLYARVDSFHSVPKISVDSVRRLRREVPVALERFQRERQAASAADTPGRLCRRFDRPCLPGTFPVFPSSLPAVRTAHLRFDGHERCSCYSLSRVFLDEVSDGFLP